TASSSNPSLVPNNVANLTPGGSGSSRTLTIKPAADAFGTTTIVLTANDGATANNLFSRTFSLVVTPVNDPPQVSVTTPTADQVFPSFPNVTLTAQASDRDGSVVRVEFYEGTTLLGTATAPPYTFVWNNVISGGHCVTAKAID